MENQENEQKSHLDDLLESSGDENTKDKVLRDAPLPPTNRTQNQKKMQQQQQANQTPTSLQQQENHTPKPLLQHSQKVI